MADLRAGIVAAILSGKAQLLAEDIKENKLWPGDLKQRSNELKRIAQELVELAETRVS